MVSKKYIAPSNEAGYKLSEINYYNAYYERGGWNRDIQYPFRYFKSLSKISALPTDPATTKSALDLGCGLGEFTEGLAAIGYGDVVGIDMSSKSIEMCEKSRLKSKRTHYVHTDFFQHDFGDRKFDFILAIGFSPFSSSNFQQVDRTLQRLRSLVHPSSSITVTVPSNGQSGGKSWYSWNVDEIESVRQLALRYYKIVKIHFFTRVARPRWPVLRFGRFSNHFIRFICWATGRRVVLCIVLQSPRAK
jgi:SAM-dependent methyltransferase